jgi:hypothetical protein
MTSCVLLSVIYAQVSCFSIVILSVIMLNDIMLSVVAPFLPDGAVESPNDERQTRRLAGRSFPDEISANLR